MRKIVLAVTALLLVAFRSTKQVFVVKYIRLGTIVEFIPNLVSLTYLRNTGAAFSILENQQWLLYGDNSSCFRGSSLLFNQTDANAEFFWLLVSLLPNLFLVV